MEQVSIFLSTPGVGTAAAARTQVCLLVPIRVFCCANYFKVHVFTLMPYCWIKLRAMNSVIYSVKLQFDSEISCFVLVTTALRHIIHKSVVSLSSELSDQ